MYYIFVGAERGKRNALRLSLSLPCYTSSLPTCSVIRAHFASCSCMQTHTDIILTERSGFDFTKAAEFSGCHAAVTGSSTAKDIVLAELLRGKNTGDGERSVCGSNL